MWYPPTLTQTRFCLFFPDNVSSLSHVEINTQTWVLALSICSALFRLVSQWCRVGRRGNNFSIIVVITLSPYHHGCLSKKPYISTALVRMKMSWFHLRSWVSWTACSFIIYSVRRQPFYVQYATPQIIQIVIYCPGKREGRGLLGKSCSANGKWMQGFSYQFTLSTTCLHFSNNQAYFTKKRLLFDFILSFR